jgi:hypothetical protein
MIAIIISCTALFFYIFALCLIDVKRKEFTRILKEKDETHKYIYEKYKNSQKDIEKKLQHALESNKNFAENYRNCKKDYDKLKIAFNDLECDSNTMKEELENTIHGLQNKLIEFKKDRQHLLEVNKGLAENYKRKRCEYDELKIAFNLSQNEKREYLDQIIELKKRIKLDLKHLRDYQEVKNIHIPALNQEIRELRNWYERHRKYKSEWYHKNKEKLAVVRKAKKLAKEEKN